MRFTVRDSLDYHQIKISVFNDDKRTDLIGETWVPLDGVVVPGGGQNDIWHTLNCKGRYAGEIRIELTYYDTRPKEESRRETSDAVYAEENRDCENENMMGPRQPKPVKRRPLPADPTSSNSSPIRPHLPDHAQSSPLPFIPTRMSQSRPGPVPATQSADGSIPYAGVSNLQLPQIGYNTTSSNQQHQSYDPDMYSEFSTAPHQANLPFYDMHPSHANEQESTIEDFSTTQDDVFLKAQSVFQSGYEDARPLPIPIQEQQQHQTQDFALPELPAYNPRLARPIPRRAQDQHVNGSSYSTPIPQVPHNRFNSDVQTGAQVQAPRTGPLGLSPVHSEGYQESSSRYRSHETHYAAQVSPTHAGFDDDGPPPPPPAHRSSGFSSPLNQDPPYHHQEFPPISAPAPLKVRHGRGSVSPSPLSHSYTKPPQDENTFSTSPITPQLSSTTAAPTPPYNSYHPPQRRQSREPEHSPQVTSYNRPPPPSLIPGYDPSVAEVESQRNRWQRQQHRSSVAYGSSPGYIESSPISGPTLAPSTPQYGNEPLRRQDLTQARAVHRNSDPTAMRTTANPDPRTPIRKSVSPQPDPGHQESRLSATPFSPDSYEALNPNLKSATSVNKPGPKYHTPDQSKDAARDREKEEKLEEGPIIGNDGRIIDPSDHLPTDTWAPEPERKTPRRGPEVTFRFRQSPLGAQPMPNSAPRPPRETVIRPHSVATTFQASTSADSTSPTSATRNRLQKKTRLSPTHAHSSPVLPVSHSGASPAYPLREHVNYGLSSSPGYMRSSPAGPPPVPAKIPMGAGQEDWGTDSLSEELRRIDIGVGAGSGRARHNRNGGL